MGTIAFSEMNVNKSIPLLLSLLTILQNWQLLATSATCNDSIGKISMGLDDDKSCSFLRQKGGDFKRTRCSEWTKIFDFCPVTCGKCFETCQDKDKKIDMGLPYGEKKCKWINEGKAKRNIRKQRCKKYGKVMDHCRLTCKLCDPIPTNCDDNAGKIKMGNEKKECIWLENWATEAQKKKKCKIRKVRLHCPLSCKLCIKDCKDNENKIDMGMSNGEKTCTWLNDRPDIKAIRCDEYPQIRYHCPKTCNAYPNCS